MKDMQNTSLNATYSHLHFNIYKHKQRASDTVPVSALVKHLSEKCFIIKLSATNFNNNYKTFKDKNSIH